MGEKYERQSRWSKKNGIAAKTYKVNKEIAEKFAEVCKQNGDSQGKLITVFMNNYIEQKEREEEMMKAIYEEMLNERVLAIKPAYEEFKESDDYKYLADDEKKDEEKVRDTIKLYLQDFTEIAIKRQMLAEAKSKNSCTEKEVRKFEEEGRTIVIGMTAEEYMDSYDEDAFEDDKEKEVYKERYVVEVKNGIVDYAFD